MNERIRELAEQAERLAEDELAHLERVHNRLYFFTEGREIYNQKFAQLIVRECCQYLDNEAERLFGLSQSEEDPVFQSNFEICAEKCYDNIQGLKEHFGVEE